MAQWLRICLAMQERDAGSTPVQGTEIPHVAKQRSLCVATTKPADTGVRAPLESQRATMNRHDF